MLNLITVDILASLQAVMMRRPGQPSLASKITLIVIGVILLTLGGYTLIKRALPMIGFEEWFKGTKGRIFSLVLIILGGFILFGAFALEKQMTGLMYKALEGCGMREH